MSGCMIICSALRFDCRQERLPFATDTAEKARGKVPGGASPQLSPQSTSKTATAGGHDPPPRPLGTTTLPHACKSGKKKRKNKRAEVSLPSLRRREWSRSSSAQHSAAPARAQATLRSCMLGVQAAQWTVRLLPMQAPEDRGQAKANTMQKCKIRFRTPGKESHHPGPPGLSSRSDAQPPNRSRQADVSAPDNMFLLFFFPLSLFSCSRLSLGQTE